MEIIIRQAMSADISSIAKACGDEGWMNLASRAQDFERSMEKSMLAVAYDGEMFAGFARAISDSVLTTFLCELLVTPPYRKKGVGAALVKYICEAFPGTRVDLISDADGFYERQGFRSLGTGFRKSQQ